MKQNLATNGAKAKLLCLACILALTVVLLTAQVWAKDAESSSIVVSWNIGGDGKTAYEEATAKDNVVATLYESGELRITGARDTAPFSQSSNAPWYENHRSTITKITFEEGVSPTSLSFFAYGCGELEAAPEIPEGITTLYGCKSLITAPKIPVNVTSLSNTFEHCSSLEIDPEIPII